MKVVWIDVDTLRADRLGCCGWDRGTSPNLDRVASEGALFRRAYTSNAPCVPSRAAMISGRFGVNNGILTHPGAGAWLCDKAFGRGGELLATRPLQRLGVHTASISSFYKHDHGRETQWFRYGFDESHDPNFTKRCQRDLSDDVNRIALPWLERHAKDDFLLHLHYWDPHTPYDLPEEVHRPFLDKPPWPWPTEALKREHLSRFYAHGPRRLGIRTMEQLDRFMKKYDAQIHDTDRHIGEVLDKLGELGVLDDTLIVVTADHGEQFGEQGMYGEHAAAVNSDIQVPLIMRMPSRVKAGTVSDALVYTQDIMPTIWEYAGAEPHETDFASLWPLVDGTKDRLHDFLVCDHGLYTATRAVMRGDLKLLLTYSPGFYGYQLYPPAALFDLSKDPYEQNDLVEQRTDEARELFELVLGWLGQHGFDESTDPLQVLGNKGPRTYNFPEMFIKQELAWKGIRAEGVPGHATWIDPRARRERATGKKAAATETTPSPSSVTRTARSNPRRS